MPLSIIYVNYQYKLYINESDSMVRQGHSLSPERRVVAFHWGQKASRRKRAHPAPEGSRAVDGTASTGQLAHGIKSVLY